MSFAEYLKEARERKGYSINRLAMRSGVSSSQISRIENSLRGTPRPENIKKLANALGIPYEEMMEAAGYMQTEEEKKEEKERPIELTEFLKSANVMYHGMPMTDEDKRRVEDVLTGLFWHAKERQQKERNKGDSGKGKSSGKSTRNE